MKDDVTTGGRWVDADEVRRRDLSASIGAWLLDTCSLTQRLQQACAESGRGGFAVKVLSQRRMRPYRDERRLLGMPEHQMALVRQVQLTCAGQPWVFARTVIPVRSLSGRGKRLARLGNRPLGAMLFADRSVRRGRLQVARLTPGNVVFASAVSGLTRVPDEIWGRRSVFHYAGRPLLVNEIFLPEVGRCHARNPLRGRYRQAA